VRDSGFQFRMELLLRRHFSSVSLCRWGGRMRAIRRKALTGSYLTPTELRNYLFTFGDNITDSKSGLTFRRANIERMISSFTPNDPCSGATVISTLNATIHQTTLGASSTGDPAPSCLSNSSNGVWFKFTSPITGQIVFDTFGSDFDTALALYTGSCGALTEVACNNNAFANGQTSKITYSASRGVSYYILATGVDGQTGNLTFNLNWVPASTVTMDATARGFYDPSGFHDPNDDSYPLEIRPPRLMSCAISSYSRHPNTSVSSPRRNCSSAATPTSARPARKRSF